MSLFGRRRPIHQAQKEKKRNETKRNKRLLCVRDHQHQSRRPKSCRLKKQKTNKKKIGGKKTKRPKKTNKTKTKTKKNLSSVVRLSFPSRPARLRLSFAVFAHAEKKKQHKTQQQLFSFHHHHHHSLCRRRLPLNRVSDHRAKRSARRWWRSVSKKKKADDRGLAKRVGDGEEKRSVGEEED